MIAAIWAQDENGLIGHNNQLPWHLPNDLKFFKRMTENNTIVMGRKTFEGMGKKPLPNRKTIVLTSDHNYQAEGIIVLHSVEEVLNYAKNSSDVLFIAGGAKIYQQFLPYCTILYRTVIEHTFKGDSWFPTVQWRDWSLSTVSEGEVDEKNPYPYKFETYHLTMETNK